MALCLAYKEVIWAPNPHRVVGAGEKGTLVSSAAAAGDVEESVSGD